MLEFNHYPQANLKTGLIGLISATEYWNDFDKPILFLSMGHSIYSRYKFPVPNMPFNFSN